MWCIHTFAEGCTTSLKRSDFTSRGSAMDRIVNRLLDDMTLEGEGNDAA